ncbi:PLDc N-terminal domain-containing protein [soil metagenome]
MLFVDGGFGLVVFALWVGCIIDVLTTDPARCRNLPKAVWVLIVLLLFDLGAVAWLIAGHPWQTRNSAGLPYRGNTGTRFPEYERPGRFAATNPDDDDQFLLQVRQRAEQQRIEYQRRRTAELQAERDQLMRRPEDGNDASAD